MATPSADDVDLLALDPQSVTTDGQSSTARSADDTIKLLNYAANLRAMALRRRGVRFSQMIPSGPLELPLCGGLGCFGNGGFC